MSAAKIRATVAGVVQNLHDLLRIDLASRDLAVRQSAEEVIAAKTALELEKRSTAVYPMTACVHPLRAGD